MVSQWHPSCEPMSKTCLIYLFWIFFWLFWIMLWLNLMFDLFWLKTKFNSSVPSHTLESRAHIHTDNLESSFVVKNECDSLCFSGPSGLGKLKGIDFCKFFLTLQQLKPSFALKASVFTFSSSYSSSNTLFQPSHFLRNWVLSHLILKTISI